MHTPREVSQRIQTALRVLDPGLRLDPATPERKIVDTVAEVIAQASVDPYVLNYQYDIDAKAGSELDKFVALFGFARQAGRRAVGSVTFSRATVAPVDILIDAGTQVVRPATAVSPQQTFVITAPVVLRAGSTSIEAPIEATVGGTLGNVPAGVITRFGGLGSGQVSEVINENATSGGKNAESDAELRLRFKNTIFRNVAGTEDQFLALAISSRFAYKANVVGPVSRFIEYLQVEPDLSINSLLPYSKYTYNFDYYLTNDNSFAETFFEPEGVDYTFTPSVPPSIVVDNATDIPVGSVVILEHTYCSASSRNDPANNILNYIDVFVSGTDAETAYESVKFPTSALDFNDTSSSPYYRQNYRRIDSNVVPTIGNRFQPLLWQPVISIPDEIVVGTETYERGVDYWLVKDITTYKGSRRARNGIEWRTNTISAGTLFTLTYTFNKLPMTLNEVMDRHKQIISDVLVHAATLRYFNVNLVVMYVPGFSKTAVDEAITVALQHLFEGLQFGAVIQLSDIVDVVHDVPGVDNVRIATPSDEIPYGIQEIAEDGETPVNVPYTNDFVLSDSELPVLNSAIVTQRSQNTWV